ncbi:MAG TPA: hypothetical protein VH914_20175 [Acidimicrobiia bacterium]|jgi:hypothetical protein|nr:hypothetical protein [Acidimicrobiia bacterium]
MGRLHWTARLFPSSDGTRDAPITRRGRLIFRVSLVGVATLFVVLFVVSVR